MDTTINNNDFMEFMEDRNALQLERHLYRGLKIMQICGFYPKRDSPSAVFVTTVAIAINIFALICSMVTIIANYSTNGAWHTNTVISTVMGMKPIQGGISILIFWYVVDKHERMIRYFCNTNLQFKQAYSHRPRNQVGIHRKLSWVVGFAFGITLVLRVTDEILLNQTYGAVGCSNTTTKNDNDEWPIIMNEWIFNYPSFIILPMLSVWQYLPVVYFVSLVNIIKRWIHVITKDARKGNLDVGKYYNDFCTVCSLQAQIGNVFSKYIMLVLSLTFITSCLVLYFIIEQAAKDNLIPNCTDELIFLTTQGMWCILQMLTLLLCSSKIVTTGYKINEASRKILQSILQSDQQQLSQADRHHVFCIAEKSRLQPGWGICVWQGYLIERSIIFTSISLILTYAMVLLRLRPPSSDTHYTHACLNQDGILGVLNQLLNGTKKL